MKDFFYKRELTFTAISVFLLLILAAAAYFSFDFMLATVKKSTQVIPADETPTHFNLGGARQLLK